MYLTVTLLATAMSPQGGPGIGPSIAPVVINEFVYDDSSTDDREFVELYNRSNAPVDISNWQLFADDPNGPNTHYTVAANVVLAPNDFYVLGSALVPNVDQVVGTTNLWQNGEDSISLLDATGAMIDTVAYETNKSYWDPTVTEGQGIWGNHTSIDGVETSWSRLADGYDSDSNGRDFRMLPQTPGATNSSGQPPVFVEPYDALTVASDVPGWGASFVIPRVVDPTVADTNNPNTIPASPQGGLAAVHWDPSGGGNTTMYTGLVGPGQVFDAWVYFDAAPEAAGELETWSIGFGTSGTFFNLPDPTGTLGYTANGNTGVTWTYEVNDTGGTLYLIDHNDGGWSNGSPLTSQTVVTSIPIQPGVNDGWRRLRLEVLGLRLCIGTFDGGPPVVFDPFAECCAAGCFPCGSGANCLPECADPTASLAYDYLYVAYREAVTNNLTLRPVTLDDVLLYPSTAVLAYQGTATATTVGTPVIAANSPPVVGNSAFEIHSFNLTNSAFGFFFAALTPSTFNLQPLGAQPGTAVLDQGSLIIVSAANGTASFAMPLPGYTGIIGLPLYWQAVDLDPALPYSLEVAASAVLETVIGG